MKFFFLMFIFIIMAVFFPPLFADTNIFTHSLVEGSRGEEVRLLQRFLNTDTDTMVAKTGAGSLGNETDYFGKATKRALEKFQEKHKAEVLVPLGLTEGTGFFGKMTREKINELYASVSKNASQSRVLTIKTLPISATTTFVTPSPTLVEKGEVIVKYPSQYTGKTGTTISLYGEGFTSTGNTVYFDTIPAIKDIASLNMGVLSFKVPSLPKGIYPLFVKNARGESKRGAFFVITDGVSKSPTIESITPLHIARRGTVTIKGAGFSATGNMVQASMAGVFENISSRDGTTLTFDIPDNLFPEAPRTGAKYTSSTMWVYVINENGISNHRTFMLDI